MLIVLGGAGMVGMLVATEILFVLGTKVMDHAIATFWLVFAIGMIALGVYGLDAKGK
jgi:hypothetical protein